MGTHDQKPGKTAADAPKNVRPSTSMLAVDLLVVDELLTIPSVEERKNLSGKLRDSYGKLDELIDELFAKKGMKRGEKISIDEDDFKRLAFATAALPSKMESGGCTSDILITLKNLLGDKISMDFLGTAGSNDRHDNLIIQDLACHNIAVKPGAVKDAKSALSFVFTHADGKRSIITYPGNAAEKLSPAMINDARIAPNNSALISLSLWSKFESTLPETFLKKATEQDKRIILTIPKQARFNYTGAADLHKRVIPQADIIVGDEEELAHWYKTDTENALRELHKDIAKRDEMRAQAGKAPREKPVVAFIKHKNDSATVLVSATADAPESRIEINAPQAISGKKHTLGVDDAMYAGFIAALQQDMTPDKAGEFAMDVAQTKFLYENVRIPGPENASPATRKEWNNLRDGLGAYDAFSMAQTGVSNAVEQKLPRTSGQKAFDFILYPLIANIGVFALSTWVTYHSNFNQNKANPFVKRSSWFKEQLAKLPGIGKSPEMTKNLNMIIWSFIDGSAMAPIVAAFEARRQDISRAIDDKLGTTPEDKSVYDQEIQRSWKDIIKARATTFGMVIATYFALNTKILPHGTQEGILNETEKSGVFKRNHVQSINGFVFDIPAKKMGGWLSGKKGVNDWAKNLSNEQLKDMARRTKTSARTATNMDARFQIEGLANTGLFEIAYTSLCTAGLYFLGKFFASKRTEQEAETPAETASAQASSHHDEQVKETESQKSWAEKTPLKESAQPAASFLDAAHKSRNEPAQIGA